MIAGVTGRAGDLFIRTQWWGANDNAYAELLHQEELRGNDRTDRPIRER